jgi:hypothetical protein
MTVPVLFYMSEQKKYERPSDELPTAPPEPAVVTDVPSLAPLESAESVHLVESASDVELETENEQRTEDGHDPTTPETLDADNHIRRVSQT